MEIRRVPVSKLNPAAYNPRKDLQPGDAEYQKLARSLEQFGCVEPVVWNERTGNVVGGHQRLKILLAAGLRQEGPNLISCPTCGRCQVDLFRIAQETEAALGSCQKDIKIAIMGCAVNGPGEARDADIGIAGGKGEMLLFRKGEPLRKVPEGEAVAALMAEVDRL